MWFIKSLNEDAEDAERATRGLFVCIQCMNYVTSDMMKSIWIIIGNKLSGSQNKHSAPPPEGPTGQRRMRQKVWLMQKIIRNPQKYQLFKKVEYTIFKKEVNISCPWVRHEDAWASYAFLISTADGEEWSDLHPGYFTSEIRFFMDCLKLEGGNGG